METRGRIKDLLVAHPALAFLGFFPPIWVVGMVWFFFAGARMAFKPDGLFGPMEVMFGLGFMLFSPIWPVVMYWEYRDSAERKHKRETATNVSTSSVETASEENSAQGMVKEVADEETGSGVAIGEETSSVRSNDDGEASPETRA